MNSGLIDKPTIGVSSCLMGQNVRYDGGHKRCNLVVDVIGEEMRIKSECPEMGVGFGVPRPTIGLFHMTNQIRLLRNHDKLDLTETMLNYCNHRVAGLAHLDGFILKKNSPSCGPRQVTVLQTDGQITNDGIGLFAKSLLDTYPWLPLVDESQLDDKAMADNFLQCVYALHRWHSINNPQQDIEAFSRFHASHKLMLMARSQTDYRQLGQWVADTNKENLATRRSNYLIGFMSAMQKPASPANHANVLMHILAYIKKTISTDKKREILLLIESYRKQETPLTHIVQELKRLLQNQPNHNLTEQYYFNPYPESLMLSLNAIASSDSRF